MRKEYDFPKMEGRKNPHAKKLKKQVTLRLGVDVIEYFKSPAQETGIPYQNLINLYLRDCAHSQKKLVFQWASQAANIALACLQSFAIWSASFDSVLNFFWGRIFFMKSIAICLP